MQISGFHQENVKFPQEFVSVLPTSETPKWSDQKSVKFRLTGPLRCSRNSGVTLNKCREGRGKCCTLFGFWRFLWMFHFGKENPPETVYRTDFRKIRVWDTLRVWFGFGGPKRVIQTPKHLQATPKVPSIAPKTLGSRDFHKASEHPTVRSIPGPPVTQLPTAFEKSMSQKPEKCQKSKK